MYMTDIDYNTGIFVSSIIANPQISLPSKYAFLYTDRLLDSDAFQRWSEVTGRKVQYLNIGPQQFSSLWGVFGKELSDQLAMNEREPNWSKGHEKDVVLAGDLPGTEEQLIGIKESFERNKEKL